MAVLGADGADADAGPVRHACSSMSRARKMLPTTRLLRLVQPLLRRTTHALSILGGTRACWARPGATCCSTRRSSAPPAGCSCKLPGSFLPEEDQGYFISMIQLPPGATRERTLEVLSQVEQYYLKQPEVEHVIGVAGFSFFGRGQNAAIAFVRLKDWDERPGKENSRDRAGAARQHGLLPHQAGDDLRHQRAADSRTGGRRRLRFPPAGPRRTRPRKTAGSAQHGAGHGRAGSRAWPACVRKARKPAPQLLLDIDRLKARALGVDIADLNETLQSALGVAYINDFVRQGRILRVQMQAEADTRTHAGGHPAPAGAEHAGRHGAAVRTRHAAAGSSARPSWIATTACRR